MKEWKCKCCNGTGIIRLCEDEVGEGGNRDSKCMGCNGTGKAEPPMEWPKNKECSFHKHFHALCRSCEDARLYNETLDEAWKVYQSIVAELNKTSIKTVILLNEQLAEKDKEITKLQLSQQRCVDCGFDLSHGRPLMKRIKELEEEVKALKEYSETWKRSYDKQLAKAERYERAVNAVNNVAEIDSYIFKVHNKGKYSVKAKDGYNECIRDMKRIIACELEGMKE